MKKPKVFCGYCKYMHQPKSGVFGMFGEVKQFSCTHPKSTQKYEIPYLKSIYPQAEEFTFPRLCCDVNEHNNCKYFAMQDSLTDKVKNSIQKLRKG